MNAKLVHAFRIGEIGALITLVIANVDADSRRTLASGDWVYTIAVLVGEALPGFVIAFLLGLLTAPRPGPPKIDPSAFD